MIAAYPACFYKSENSYSVIFPDLNYLATYGDSYDDAVRMAIDCLAGYIYMAQIDGDEIPEPSSPDAVSPKALAEDVGFEEGESFVKMITVDVEEYAKEHFDEWDSDYTKLTPTEYKRLLEAENGEYVNAKDIDWNN